MNRLNTYRLIIMIILMIPNMIFAREIENIEMKHHNKFIEIME